MLPFRKRTRKASVKAPDGASPASPHRVFGVAFDRNAETIPIVIRKVVEYFDQSDQGVNIEGLFRISGQQSDIKKIVEQFDSGEVPDLTGYDPHVAAGVLKQYLRELPEPLLTFELYDCFLAAASVPETAQASTVRKVLCMLPRSHRIVLKYLARFLHRVSLEASSNKMTPANIAIVFAPNLLKPPGDDLMMQMRDTEFSNHLMILFISEFDSIFTEEPEPGQPSRSAQPLSRRHRRSSSWSGSQAELDELTSGVPILHTTEVERTPKIDAMYLRSESQPSTGGLSAGRTAGFTISRSRPGDLTSSGELRVASPTRPIMGGSPPASPPPSKKLPPKPNPRHRSATNTTGPGIALPTDRPSSPLARSPMPIVRARNRTETVSIDNTVQTAAPYTPPQTPPLTAAHSSRGYRGRGQLLRGTAPSSSARNIIPLPPRGQRARGAGAGAGVPQRGRGGRGTPPMPTLRNRTSERA